MTNPEQFRDRPQIDSVSGPSTPRHSLYFTEELVQVEPPLGQPYPNYSPEQIDYSSESWTGAYRAPWSVKAFLSLILSIACVLFFPGLFIAIILGVLARRDIAKGKTRGKAIANTGIIIAVVLSIIFIILGLGAISGNNSTP